MKRVKECLVKHPTSVVYNMDCMDGMKEYPDGYFDVCITDFPYGVGVDYGVFSDTESDTVELIKTVMPEILRVSKRAVITSGTKLMYHYPKPDWVGCVFSPAGVGVGAYGFCCWQPILIYGKDPKYTVGKGSHPDSFIYTAGNDKESSFHPVPKPYDFWSKIYRRWTNERDVKVLDPFMGSGTGRIVSYQMGLDFYGYELNADYFKASEERFQKYLSQPNMFREEQLRKQAEQIAIQL